MEKTMSRSAASDLPLGPGAGNLEGNWKSTFEARGRRLIIEYRFLKSGSGIEHIFNGSDRKVIEMHRFLWCYEDDILKLNYITENMSEIRMRCIVEADTCILSDPDSPSDAMFLERMPAEHSG